MESVGERIRAAREAARLSADDLGQAAGIHGAAVRLIESGETRVSAVVLAELAAILGTTPAALLGYDGGSGPAPDHGQADGTPRRS